MTCGYLGMIFLKFENVSKIYEPNDIKKILSTRVDENQLVNKSGGKIQVYNIPCAFDIESTSFYYNGEKQAIMYEWTLGINGAVIIGREWKEFLQCIDIMQEYLHLSEDKRVIIYIQNFSFEFQFFRKMFDWLQVFSIDTRKPIFALSSKGVEFRCSYLLSGYSLAKIGENLHTYKCKKMVGDLDYTLLRHSKTPLTEKEIKYCENDVRVIMSYIQECIEKDGDITKIPYTKTGYVRNYCRKNCYYSSNSHKKTDKKYNNYRDLMLSLTLTEDEYLQLKRAFQGGFTHANANFSGKHLNGVTSYDFTSSYPAVMVMEKFPMSKGRTIKINTNDELLNYLKNYCCLFDIEFFNLESCTFVEHPLSFSHCCNTETVIVDNGRVVSAKKATTTITEQDFFVYKKFYTWEKARIYNFRIYKKGYLPTDFVKSVLKLYSDKTTLKDVDGKEVDYLHSKEMVNSCYGMTVTDICRDDVNYIENEWNKEKPNIEIAIDKYNKSKKRFLFYPWGVWITAYARKNLFTGIYEFGEDYVYSDTDSVKGLNAEKHKLYIEKYNDSVIKKMENAMEYHGLPLNSFRPKTINGIEKPLGVWDFDGFYDDFKTLGAKRYITVKNGKISFTVSGVNKKSAIPYLQKKYNDVDKIFNAFDDGMYIPANFTGKNTHTYIDESQTGTITDYLGNTIEYHELTGVHLEKTDFTLSLSDEYINYLTGITINEW